jgi:hypothetical protein
MIFRAGFALNIVGSFVNGLMPFRAFVAGFLMTINLAMLAAVRFDTFFGDGWAKGGLAICH